MRKPVYMDHHATTPVDPRVLEAMLPFFCENFGNAASRSHQFGWDAEQAVNRARMEIARLVGGQPKEIIFTSGGTESDNLAIKGVAEFNRDKGRHIITAATEHRAVLDTCSLLEKRGFRVTRLPVDSHGRADPDDLRRALTKETILISIMHANNEIGTLHPVSEIGRIAKENGILFHCDATQSFGKVPIDVQAMGVDLLSLSAHKIYGPKGIGALYVRSKNPRVRLVPLIDGGGHETGIRSGTLNVPGIVGLGRASEICGREMATEQARLLELRERLSNRITSRLDEVHLNGHPTMRLAGNLNLSFKYVEAESLLMALKDIALSSGSACTSASLEPSHVLKALRVPEDLAHGSIRFGLGRFNTEEEVDYVGDRVADEVIRLRKLSPLHRVAKERSSSALPHP